MFAAGLVGFLAFLVVFAIALGQWMGQAPRLEMKQTTVAMVPSRFFATGATGPATFIEIPVEVFLSQLESHIRLESAAAENFVHQPSADSLHARTTSPLLN